MTDASPRPVRRAFAPRRLFVGGAFVVPVVAWGALALGAATPLRGLVASRASAALGQDVSISGPLRIIVTPFSIRFSADNVRIAGAQAGPELLRVDRAEAGIAWFDLLIGRAGLRALSLRDGTLQLVRTPDGRRNWGPNGSGKRIDLATLREIRADNLRLHYSDAVSKLRADLDLADGGAGVVRLTGHAGSGPNKFALQGMLRSGADEAAQIEILLRNAGSNLRLAGMAETPLKLGTSALKASAQGRDFAQLAALAGIALPSLPGYALQADVSRSGQRWRFSHVAGHIGGTDLAGSLTLDRRGARPAAVARLRSQTLDPADIKRLFGLAPAPGGQLPELAFDRAALSSFDAVIEYRAERLADGTNEPVHLNMKLALVRGALLVSPASIDLAGGFLSSDLLIDTRQKPALVRADIRLSPAPMGQLLAGWGIAPTGTTATMRGRVVLTGRGDRLSDALGNASGRIALIMPGGDVHVRQASSASLDAGNVGAAIFRTAGPVTSGLNCGLIAFTVDNGIARADPALLDTRDHLIKATGSIDLRAQRLDMRLSAEGKAFALFARPNPVRISGSMWSPELIREPVSWFRPANLFGLTVHLPDLGEILGFVDPHETQAPVCGTLLRSRSAAINPPASQAMPG